MEHKFFDFRKEWKWRVNQLYNSNIFMKTLQENESISRKELSKMAQKMGGLVKAVVDVKKKTMIVDADLHADQEAQLLEMGSSQGDLWGINLYPDEQEDYIEYDSMINIRPRQGNKSRSVENEEIQKEIKKIVTAMVL